MWGAAVLAGLLAIPILATDPGSTEYEVFTRDGRICRGALSQQGKMIVVRAPLRHVHLTAAQVTGRRVVEADPVPVYRFNRDVLASAGRRDKLGLVLHDVRWSQGPGGRLILNCTDVKLGPVQATRVISQITSGMVHYEAIEYDRKFASPMTAREQAMVRSQVVATNAASLLRAAAFLRQAGDAGTAAEFVNMAATTTLLPPSRGVPWSTSTRPRANGFTTMDGFRRRTPRRVHGR